MSDIILKLTLLELFSLIGLVQCVYILVSLVARAEKTSQAFIPFLFFTSLGSAFLLTLAQSRWLPLVDSYSDIQWILWALCTPLSAIFILHILGALEKRFKYIGLILFLPIIFYVCVHFFDINDQSKNDFLQTMQTIIGCLSLLSVWLKRAWLDTLAKRKNGRDCWWLIISLVVLNIGFISLPLLMLYDYTTSESANFIRVILSLSFVYVASTILMRIYPYSAFFQKQKPNKDDLTTSELETAFRIENLLYLDKVYQEPSYNRGVMARELMLSESHLSKIVNIYFNKTVPQLLNAYRVAEAQGYLKQTDMDITVISAEAGFNSIATFNRVFKDIVGVSPSEYKKRKN